MNWHYTPYVLPLLAAAAFSAALAAYAFRHRTAAAGAGPFTLMMSAIAYWTFGNALQVAGADLPTKLLWGKLQYPGVVVVPLAWLALVLQYTGRAAWITPRRIALASVVPIVTLGLVFTAERHGLYWRGLHLVEGGPYVILALERGPGFWLNTGYCYVGLMAGAVLMLRRISSSSGLSRGQATWLLLGVLIPWAVNAFYIFGLWHPALDPTPFAMTLSGAAFAFGLFRYRIFDLSPVAREAVIEGMADGMLVLDEEERIVDLNPAALAMFGLTAFRVLGRPFEQALAAWPEVVQRCRSEGDGSAELTLEQAGEDRHYDLSVSQLRDRRGRACGRLLVWRDVTARFRAQAELRSRKQLFEDLLAVARATTARPTLDATLQNTLEVVSSLTGAEGASLFLLDEAGRLSRMLLAEGRAVRSLSVDTLRPVLDKGLAGWVVRHRQPAVVSDTATDERWLRLGPSVESFQPRSALSVPIASGETLVGVLTLVHSQKDRFDARQLEFMQAAAHQIALAVRHARMFDERASMAERQTILYEVLRAVGGQLDPDEVARTAVSAISQRTGWSNVVVAVPTEDGTHWKIEVASQELSQLGERQPLGRGVVGRAFLTGRMQVVPDVSLDPDYMAGSPRIRSEIAVPLRRGERKLGVLNLESERLSAFGPDEIALAESLADAVGLALDNARLYRALAHEHGRLRDLERLRDELTDTLVHDLRTPLTSMSGVLDLLYFGLHEPGNDEPRDLLQRARHSAERMAGLIDAILDVSRLEAGRMPLQPAPVALAPLVRETFDLQASLAQEKGLSFENAVAEQAPPAWADAKLLARVLQNLVGNAVKFSPAGGQVRVSAEVQASEPRMLRIAVSDSGPGVSESVRDRLFQKFVSGGTTRSTGLGLAFCRLAVEAHGGRIWVESGAGHGSTFTFTLPTAA